MSLVITTHTHTHTMAIGDNDDGNGTGGTINSSEHFKWGPLSFRRIKQQYNTMMIILCDVTM